MFKQRFFRQTDLITVQSKVTEPVYSVFLNFNPDKIKQPIINQLKMNKLTKSAAGLILTLCAFSFSSCDDNSDVIGLNDATKYGYIKVTLEGTDPNGDDFEVTRNFKFAPSGSPQYTSSVYTYDDDGFYQEFDVTRYLGPLNSGDGNDSYADLYLYNENEGDPDFSGSELYITTSITTDNKEFFTLSEDLDIEDEDITSYQYNSETGKLSLKFKTIIPGNENITGFPLIATVNVNVTVFENLTPGGR